MPTTKENTTDTGTLFRPNANIISYRNKHPQISKDAYINPYALIIGEVIIEPEVTVWPGAILRGDDGPVIIRKGAAILDKAFLEAPQGTEMVVGDHALISHGVRLHGCAIGAGTLIGIGAVVLEHATIGKESIIGASALVTAGTMLPERSLALGTPARVVRTITDEEVKKTQAECQRVREKAREYGDWFMVGQWQMGDA